MSLLVIWDAVEADFMRDYHIDLTQELDGMSWRKFQVLVQNLSPMGAAAMRIRMEQDSVENVAPEEARAAGDRFFADVISA